MTGVLNFKDKKFDEGSASKIGQSMPFFTNPMTDKKILNTARASLHDANYKTDNLFSMRSSSVLQESAGKMPRKTNQALKKKSENFNRSSSTHDLITG